VYGFDEKINDYEHTAGRLNQTVLLDYIPTYGLQLFIGCADVRKRIFRKVFRCYKPLLAFLHQQLSHQ
jgi:hypothetical protein